MYSRLAMIAAVLLLVGCAHVHQEDTDVWAGKPVSMLEKHPVFLTMPVVKTRASDGTEIWNYVNGRSVSRCSSGGSVFSGTINYAAYSGFSSCMQAVMACNNIFYIKDGIVQQFTPIGTGGARCFTDKRTRPDFHGSTDI